MRPPMQRKTNRPPLAADENNVVLKAFAGYAQELDDKHDTYERIVKFSRDITIESKRIIFLLHTIDARKQNRAKVLHEAETRLQKVIDVNFRAIAQELKHRDPYRYRGAYSPGLQEFIEAYSFAEYFKHANDEGCLSDWEALQKRTTYTSRAEKPDGGNKAEEKEQGEGEVNKEVNEEEFSFFVDPSEYILGLSDLTGELMRRCINSLGSGETDACMSTCRTLQGFYTGYMSLNVARCRELSRKIYTMRQSVLKAENVCYNVRVRGTEAAKWSAMETKVNDHVDEGFY